MAVADNIYISTGADMVSVANKIRDKAGVSDGLVSQMDGQKQLRELKRVVAELHQAETRP